MPDEDTFTELLDTYFATKKHYEYVDANTYAMDMHEKQDVVDRYMAAKDKLNGYMLFIRLRVHTHDDIFMGTGKSDEA